MNKGRVRVGVVQATFFSGETMLRRSLVNGNRPHGKRLAKLAKESAEGKAKS
jgi:hypothetical protein